MMKTKHIFILTCGLLSLTLVIRMLSPASPPTSVHMQKNAMINQKPPAHLTEGMAPVDTDSPKSAPAPTVDLRNKNQRLRGLFEQHADLTFNGLYGSEIKLDTSPEVAENTFYDYVEHLDVICKNSRRFGRKEDGGWDWCMYGPYAPIKDKCLVYSFGIGTEWSFDDAISNTKEYGCIDRAFDPTNNKKDHVRGERIHFYSRGIGGSNKVDQLIAYNIKHPAMVLQTFAAFREEFNDTYTPLDYLKMDVEYSEWEAFRTILYNGDLSNVKQIGIEIHTNEVFANKHSSVALLKLYYDILRGIEDAGFLKWHAHANMAATYNSEKTKKKRTCCYEMKWINWKLLSGDFDSAPNIVPVNKKYTWSDLTIGQMELRFDMFLHDIHHKCSHVVHVSRQVEVTKSEKISICADEFNGKSSTIYTIGLINSDAARIKAGIESEFKSQVNMIVKSNNDTTKSIKEMEKEKEIHILIIDVDLKCWDFIKQFLKSTILKKVNQLVIMVKTKEASGGETSMKDFLGYQTLLQSIQEAGYHKWLVKNTQNGMYDSKRTGDRVASAFQLHFLRKK